MRTTGQIPRATSMTGREQRTGSTDHYIEMVHDELRRLAAAYLRGDSMNGMLEPAVLVNEAYLRLSIDPSRSWTGREQFLAIAAKAMRTVLIDHARRRCTLKRGYGRSRIALEVLTDSGPYEIDIRLIDRALEELARVHERAAHIVELRFFADLTNAQVSEVLGVSRKTVVQDWGRAREFLSHRLSELLEGPARPGA
ncbi:MAG: ECF-type sigma factor [Planctomycetota bacterium]|jgi:RNA polymerase sigma factor (TIGR02999 family)